MSGMRQYIYLYRRIPQKWENVSCKILDFCVGCLVMAITVILAIVGILLLYLM